MQTSTVDHITSNEQHVRMRIFDGSLEISDAGGELLRIEKEQHAQTWRELLETRARLSAALDLLAQKVA